MLRALISRQLLPLSPNCLMHRIESGHRHDSRRSSTQLEGIDPTSVSLGEGLNFVGIIVRERYWRDMACQATLNRSTQSKDTAHLISPRSSPDTKPRPLAGVWATAPYLHNGSVPSIYQLLSPDNTDEFEDKRCNRFYVGLRGYDPVRMGLPVAEDRCAEEPSEHAGNILDTARKAMRTLGISLTSRIQAKPRMASSDRHFLERSATRSSNS